MNDNNTNNTAGTSTSTLRNALKHPATLVAGGAVGGVCVVAGINAAGRRGWLGETLQVRAGRRAVAQLDRMDTSRLRSSLDSDKGRHVAGRIHALLPSAAAVEAEAAKKALEKALEQAEAEAAAAVAVADAAEANLKANSLELEQLRARVLTLAAKQAPTAQAPTAQAPTAQA